MGGVFRIFLVACHLQIVAILLLLFQFGFILFLFLIQLLWSRLPVFCWIKVARVDILVFFLILEKMLSAFHCWVWCELWVYHIWPLLCWVMVSPYQLCGGVFIINGCWIFVKSFFCVCWNGFMIFILQFVNVVCYIVWFGDIEIHLHSWDKSHLIMVYDPFNVLLNLVC